MWPDGRVRCGWAAGDSLLARYHDLEWGVPPGDDDAHFEALTLEIFQAGLSWRTVLYTSGKGSAARSLASASPRSQHSLRTT